MADSTSPETNPIRKACLEWIRNERYDEAVTCPECDSVARPRSGPPYYSRRGAKMYDCPDCELTFNDLTGTVFNGRYFPLETYFYIVCEAPSKSAAQIARELDCNSHTVLEFLEDIEDETVIDVAALRDAFADVDLVPSAASDGAAPTNDESVRVPVEQRRREELKTLKTDADETYDEVINRLLDAAGIATPDTDLGPLGSDSWARTPNSGGFDERTTIVLTRGTRKRLKLWKSRHALSYDEALQRLLTEATDESA